MKLLISYAAEDEIQVEPLATRLEACGWPVLRWPLRSEDSLLSRVKSEVEPDDQLIVILTPAAARARWFQRGVTGGELVELAQARGLGEYFLIPVLYKPCEVPIMLRGKIYANFVTQPFETAWDDLYRIIHKKIGFSEQEVANRVIRTWTVEPVGSGKHAVLIEFGVYKQRLKGLHVEVDFSVPYTASKDWYGPPNTPTIPKRPGGPFFNSSLRRQPPLYVRRFVEPDITPTQSYYLYAEAEEPLAVHQYIFADAHGREI